MQHVHALAGLARQRLGDSEKLRAEPLASMLRIGGEHVHIPTVRREVLQLLERHEHRRHGGIVNRLRLGRLRIADQAGGATAVDLGDHGIAIGKGALLAFGAAAADIPGCFAGFPDLVPDMECKPFAGEIHQLGECARILRCRAAERRLKVIHNLVISSHR